MRVAVAGAGLAGLVAALRLAREGADVVLVEPDPPPSGHDTDDLCARLRPGAPQGVHPHNFMPLARRLLARDLPDVHAEVLAAGGQEVDLRPHLPAGEPDDERERDLVALAVRRPLLEHLLRRAVGREPRVEVRAAHAVEVLPRGLRTTAGDVAAELVVDASGRRSPLPGSLAAAGEPVRIHEQPCGITYVTRHYRLREEGLPAPLFFGLAARIELPSLMAALFLADDRVFSVIVGTPPADRELRRLLVDEHRYDAVLGQLPTHAPWVAPDASYGITGVRVMGGLSNVLVETGEMTAPYVGIGDAVLTTNPRLGWGASLAFLHVSLLLDRVAHGADAAAATRAAVVADARARWQASVDDDVLRTRWWAGGAWEPTLAACLATAAQDDRIVAVATARRLGLLDPPDGYRDALGVLPAVQDAERALRLRGPVREPSRDALLAAAQAAPAGSAAAD